MEYLAYLEMVIAAEEENITYDLPPFKLNWNWKKTFKSAWLTFASIGILFAMLTHVQTASAAYYGPGRYYVNTHPGECLNIRNHPSLDAAIVTCVNNGSQLPPVTGYRNGFARLSTGNYISSKWISTTPSSKDEVDSNQHHHGYPDHKHYKSYYKIYYASYDDV